MKSVLHIEFDEAGSTNITKFEGEGMTPGQFWFLAKYLAFVAEEQYTEFRNRTKLAVATTEDVRQILK